jgi:hypothetical protein
MNQFQIVVGKVATFFVAGYVLLILLISRFGTLLFEAQGGPLLIVCCCFGLLKVCSPRS